MNRILTTTALVAFSASAASAAGIERTPFSTSVLFEKGNYTEFSLGYAMPDVTGNSAAVFGSTASGDVAGDYLTFGGAVKGDIDQNWSWALLVDNYYGADVDYTDADPTYPLAGLTAGVDSVGVTGLVKYTTANNISVYGGLRYETLEGEVENLILPVPGVGFLPYNLSTDTSKELGYILGAAWERPDIAARVALTYMSARDHDLEGTETLAGGPLPGGTFTTTIPQSVTLDFQSGVAADTLVFGSVKWTEWSEFNISPVSYTGATGSPLISYQDDTWALNLGVGRRFNENWSGAVSVGYETGTGQPVGNLGPTEGQKSIGLAATYTDGPMKITTGVRYVALGDGTTQTIGSIFEDNSAVAVGVKVGYSF